MITFICLFFPAITSAYLHAILTKSSLNPLQFLGLFATDTILINSICFFFKVMVFHTGELYLYDPALDITPSTALKYLVIAFPSAIIIAFVTSILAKKATVSVENNEK